MTGVRCIADLGGAVRQRRFWPIQSLSAKISDRQLRDHKADIALADVISRLWVMKSHFYHCPWTGFKGRVISPAEKFRFSLNPKPRGTAPRILPPALPAGR